LGVSISLWIKELSKIFHAHASFVTLGTTKISHGKEDMELPMFDLAAIANAIDNFSNNMKLGEGGFGLMYKVNNNINRRAIFFIFRAISCITIKTYTV
jgi:hypothetical protein